MNFQRLFLTSEKEDREMSFIKWVGGKSKLLNKVVPKLINEIKPGTTYLDPFIGSGSVLIELMTEYEKKGGKLNEVDWRVNDVNKELITSFLMIKFDVENLIKLLNRLELKYVETEKKDELYYLMRDYYNEMISGEDITLLFVSDLGIDEGDEILNEIDDLLNLSIASLFIFLNKTCFRGLYRVNKNGSFNVPFGNYKNPKLVNPEELRRLSYMFRYVKFYDSDYKTLLEHNMKSTTIIYLDPPYFDTFNDYSNINFNHDDFYGVIKMMNSKNDVHLVISNSFTFSEKYDLSEFEVEEIMINDKINSKSPNSSRKEIIAISKNKVI